MIALLRNLSACLALLLAAQPLSATELRLVADGYVAPIGLADPADGSGRLFVQEQHGLVGVLNADGSRGPVLLDLRPRMLPVATDFEERGLLGFALHPDFASNGRVYALYTAPLRPDAPSGWNHTKRVSEFTLAPGAERIDLESERVLLALDWPSRKHNGGALAFDAEGRLLVGLGDGGGAHGVGPEVLWSAFDVPAEQLHWDRLAQDATSLYGKILRLDVDAGFPGYGVPDTNPFVGRAGRDEIIAWGLRNPFRVSVDRQTGAMLVTAIAETLWEAVYLFDGPANLGWPIREGFHCVDRLRPRDPPEDCPRHGPDGWRISDPVVEYANMQVMHPETKVEATGLGAAVTGALIYRGAALPELYGKLLVSDWSASFEQPSGQIFVATPAERHGEAWPLTPLLRLETRIVGLATDAAGEVYVLATDRFGPFGETGKIYKLEP